MKHLVSLVFICIFAIGLNSCGSDSKTRTVAQVPSYLASDPAFYFKTSERLNFDIYYEEGQEPYTGQTNDGLNYWDISFDNMTQIMSYRTTPPVIDIPTELNEMTPLGAIADESWTAQEIADYAIALDIQSKQEQTASFTILFLDGYFSQDGEDVTNVIGVNITGTPIIAIFKRVVEAAGTNANQRVFVEQSTLVHEMGHALGFVDSGVPAVSSHHDEEHGAHTKNSDCVMYYLNEGPADLRRFLLKYITTGDTTMWGPEVLQDANVFSE